MDIDILSKQGEVIFGEDEIKSVVDFLKEKLNECKILAFIGPLGAGKTTLIRMLLRSLDITEPITSPTFIYVNRYSNKKGNNFYHFDLYRIESVSDFLEAGFDEYFEQPNSWVFIEWPEIIMDILPDDACLVKLDYHGDKRKIKITTKRENK